MKEVCENTYLLCDGSILTFDGTSSFELFPSSLLWKPKTKKRKYIFNFSKEIGLIIFNEINRLLQLELKL